MLQLKVKNMAVFFLFKICFWRKIWKQVLPAKFIAIAIKKNWHIKSETMMRWLKPRWNENYQNWIFIYFGRKTWYTEDPSHSGGMAVFPLLSLCSFRFKVGVLMEPLTAEERSVFPYLNFWERKRWKCFVVSHTVEACSGSISTIVHQLVTTKDA